MSFNKKQQKVIAGTAILLGIVFIMIGSITLPVTTGLVVQSHLSIIDVLSYIIGGYIIMHLGLLWHEVKNERKWYEKITINKKIEGTVIDAYVLIGMTSITFGTIQLPITLKLSEFTYTLPDSLVFIWVGCGLYYIGNIHWRSISEIKWYESIRKDI